MAQYLHNIRHPPIMGKKEYRGLHCNYKLHSAVMEKCELGIFGSLFAENSSTKCFHYQHLNKFVSSVQHDVSINMLFTPKIPVRGSKGMSVITHSGTTHIH